MIYAFEDYELDLPRYELRYAGKLVKLEPQVFNVLAYLIQHRDRVITKEELLERLWPGRFVGEATLTSRLTAARRAIGDRGREQRLIQTIHGRGYRFIGLVKERGAEASAQADRPLIAHHPAAVNSPAPPGGPATSKSTQAVGREAERERLHRCFQRALGGSRQVVFVTGEAGLGKTTLVETFLQEIDGYAGLRIGQGQCIEHYGVGEAYLPVLEALGQLCKEPAGQELLGLLAKQAPTWLVQMPWLVSGAELDALQRRVMGATQERMLREMAEVLAVVAAERPLILVLEDLHWSDYATLDLIAWLARQQEPTRLLVLGTYRPADVRVQGHPLQAVVQELKMHRRGEELALTLLTEGAVEEYLAARFAGSVLPQGLPRLVHQRTEGNPLFMVNIVDAWEAEGWLEEPGGDQSLRPGIEELAQGVPESLRQMLSQQFDRLGPDEQRVLEAASVAGVECSAAAVAAGLGIDVIEAETWCEGLARRQQWLHAIGSEEWPDGTVAGRYAFIHALYHDVVYQRVAAARRIHLHRGIGASKAAAYGPRAGEIAAELAVHFEHGRDYQQAVQYLQRAAETATQRHAQREAIEYLRRALGMLKAMPGTPETLRQELEVQLALGPAFMVTKGFAASEVADTYARARQLCEHLGDDQRLFSVLFGLWRSSHVRAELQTARALGEQLLSLANRGADPALLVEAHAALGQTLCIQGELILAREHLHQVVTLYEPQRHTALAFRLGYDPGIYARAVEAWALWLSGHPEQALQRSRDALDLAQAQSHPFTIALTLATTAVLQQLRQDGEATLEHVKASVVLSSEHGYPYLRTIGTVRQGWGLAVVGQVEEGIAQMRQGLAALRAAGTELLRPYYLALLAEAYGLSGQIDAGLEALEEAIVAADQHAERFYEAELHRLRGELLLQKHAASGFTHPSTEIHMRHAVDARGGPWAPLQIEADACFQRALDLARRQGAMSLELRAAMSRYRLWSQLGNGAETRHLLAQVYDRFTEGFETVDLREARELLEGRA